MFACLVVIVFASACKSSGGSVLFGAWHSVCNVMILCLFNGVKNRTSHTLAHQVIQVTRQWRDGLDTSQLVPSHVNDERSCSCLVNATPRNTYAMITLYPKLKV